MSQKRRIKIVELFSGIGAQTRAFENIDVKLTHVAISDWFTKAIVGYAAIHKNSENIPFKNSFKDIKFSNDSKSPSNKIVEKYKEIFLKSVNSTRNMTDITIITGESLKLESNGEIDILTYSFPCQDLSIAGHKKGLFEGNASSLLWEVGRILKELKAINCLPKALMMENVKNLLSSRFEEGWNEWLFLLETLGYKTSFNVINAKDHGLAQNRERVFAVSSLSKEFDFSKIRKREAIIFKDIMKSLPTDKFDEKINKLKYTEKKISRSNISKSVLINYTNFNSENDVFYIDGILPTITARGAYSRHKIFDNGKIRFVNVYEKARLMGFKDSDVDKLKKIKMTDTEISFLFGNSIAVNVLEDLFNEMFIQKII